MPTKPLLIILPAHNEEASLPFVLRELKEAQPEADVVVIDDGSTDRTGIVAAEGGALVIRHASQRGTGAALTTGYTFAVQEGYDRLVRMDADGQSNPAYIDQLLETLDEEGCDLVAGVRATGETGERPRLVRRAGALWLSLLARALTGGAVRDTASRFTAMNRRAIRFLAVNTPKDYADVNVRVALHKAGLRVVESPVPLRRRIAGRSKSAHALIYAPTVLYRLAGVYRDGPQAALPDTDAPTKEKGE